MKRAIAYLRVSTKEQGDSKLGLEAQARTIEEFAKANGYEVSSYIEEVASGALGLESRQMLRYAIAQGKKNKCTILVAKLDRLSRDVAFISSLMTQRIPFVCCDLGADQDPFVLHLYAAFVERERRIIGQRTKAGLASIKQRITEQGHYVSRAGNVIAALGNPDNIRHAGSKGRDVVVRQADEFAARLRPTIERMRRDGMSLQAIAKELNLQGTPTARGGTWTAKTVCNLVARWE